MSLSVGVDISSEIVVNGTLTIFFNVSSPGSVFLYLCEGEGECEAGCRSSSVTGILSSGRNRIKRVSVFSFDCDVDAVPCFEGQFQWPVLGVGDLTYHFEDILPEPYETKPYSVWASTVLFGETACSETFNITGLTPVCDDGWWGSVSTVCTACEAGKFSAAESPANSSSACVSCQAGETSSAGATFCTACEPGSWSDDPASGCVDCPVGTASSATGANSNATCEPCGNTSFSSPGSAVCTNCPGLGDDGLSCNGHGSCDLTTGVCNCYGAWTPATECRVEFFATKEIAVGYIALACALCMAACFVHRALMERLDKRLRRIANKIFARCLKNLNDETRNPTESARRSSSSAMMSTKNPILLAFATKAASSPGSQSFEMVEKKGGGGDLSNSWRGDVLQQHQRQLITTTPRSSSVGGFVIVLTAGLAVVAQLCFDMSKFLVSVLMVVESWRGFIDVPQQLEDIYDELATLVGPAAELLSRFAVLFDFIGFDWAIAVDCPGATASSYLALNIILFVVLVLVVNTNVFMFARITILRLARGKGPGRKLLVTAASKLIYGFVLYGMQLAIQFVNLGALFPTNWGEALYSSHCTGNGAGPADAVLFCITAIIGYAIIPFTITMLLNCFCSGFFDHRNHQHFSFFESMPFGHASGQRRYVPPESAGDKVKRDQINYSPEGTSCGSGGYWVFGQIAFMLCCPWMIPLWWIGVAFSATMHVLRFMPQICRVTCGYWSTLAHQSMDITATAEEYDDDTATAASAGKQQEVMSVRGQVVGLIWMYFPSLTIVTKFAELMNETPAMTPPWVVLRDPLRQRSLLCFLNFLKFVCLVVVSAWPRGQAWLVIAYAGLCLPAIIIPRLPEKYCRCFSADDTTDDNNQHVAREARGEEICQLEAILRTVLAWEAEAAGLLPTATVYSQRRRFELNALIRDELESNDVRVLVDNIETKLRHCLTQEEKTILKKIRQRLAAVQNYPPAILFKSTTKNNASCELFVRQKTGSHCDTGDRTTRYVSQTSWGANGGQGAFRFDDFRDNDDGGEDSGRPSGCCWVYTAPIGPKGAEFCVWEAADSSGKDYPPLEGWRETGEFLQEKKRKAADEDQFGWMNFLTGFHGCHLIRRPASDWKASYPKDPKQSGGPVWVPSETVARV